MRIPSTFGLVALTVLAPALTWAQASYDETARTLVLPSVTVNGATYSNVKLKLNDFEVIYASGPAVTPSDATLRFCTLHLGNGYAEVNVRSRSMGWRLVANINQVVFEPNYFFIRQGMNPESQLALGTAAGHTFVWTGHEGFVLGPIPVGTERRGDVTWVNTWFDTRQSFSIYNSFTGSVTIC